MKKKLVNWIFKKEIKKIHDDYKARTEYEKRKVSDLILSLQIEDKIREENYSLAKRAFRLFPHGEIIGIVINDRNNDEEVYVIKVLHNDYLCIYLMSRTYQAINDLPSIAGSIYWDYETGEGHIKIDDVQNKDNSKGNGKIAMDYFLKTAVKMKMKYVIGDLSSNDQDHFDRVISYYTENKFDVTLDKTKSHGSIIKYLNT